MRNDTIIRSIRYILDVDDAQITEITKLGGYKASRDEMSIIFDENEEKDCSHELLAHFLDGLIYYKRGKSKDHPQPPIQVPVTNNMILKKLRVAFKLREEDMHEILKSVDFPVSRPELSALFRKKNHKNFRESGDQLLRYFLQGLTKRERKDTA
ncbi:MAG: DUF1456 family protein [Balneolaceae bacterium]